MNNRRIVLPTIFFICIQFHIIQSHELHPPQETTELIEFIKNQKDRLTDLQDEAQLLMDRCIYDYSYTYRNHQHHDFYIKRSASLADLQELYDIQQEILHADELLKERIADLIDQGESFDEVDAQNHTALYYAQSTQVYNALRSSGASFELIPFLYMYQWYAVPASTALLFIVYKLYEVGYFSFDRCISYSQKIYGGTLSTLDDLQRLISTDKIADKKTDMKNPVYDRSNMHSRDALGRTPLMNYLIEQEEILFSLRLQIDDLWNDDAEWDDYYAVITQHTVTCHQTQIQIKKMIELGAALDIQDTSGKTLLDHCVTKEIYETLLALGTPFQVNLWIHFNYDYFVKKAPYIAPIVGISLLVSVYMTVRNNISFKDERSEWFETWAKRHLS